MRTSHGILITLVLATMTMSCKKDKTAPVDLGLAYFPIDTGRWVEYQVDSVWYDEAFGLSGSLSYLLREEIFEEFSDPAGRPAQRIRRRVWVDSLNSWRTRDIWWQTRDNFAAEKTEENLRRLKLTFPMSTGKFWNANIYNTQQEAMDLTYDQVHVPWSSGSLGFDSTTTVRGTYFNNLVDTLIFQERYAKHVGLVYKFWHDSKTDYHYPPPPDPPVITTRGWRITMQVVAYGGH